MRIEVWVGEPEALGGFAVQGTAVLGASSLGEAAGGGYDGVWRWFADGQQAFGHGAACGCCGAGRALEAALGGIFADVVRGVLAPVLRVVVLVPQAQLLQTKEICLRSLLIRSRFDWRGVVGETRG